MSPPSPKVAPRLACLMVPDLPLQALVRAEPSLAQVPLLIAEGEGPRARVLCVSAPARSLGVRRGVPVSDALAVAPRALVRWTPAEILEAARAAVLDAAVSVSPRVEEVAPGVALVDADGLSRLHGGDRGVASALCVAASRLGFTGRAGVAGTRRVAQVAAARGEGIEVVPAGQERAYLAPLPVAAFAGERTAATLLRWGIHTMGELAALPSDGVGARLGAEGAALHRLASGLPDGPLQPRPMPQSFEEGVDLDHEIFAIEPLLFLLRPAIERLTARLDCHAVACGGLTLRLLLDPAGEAHLPVELAAPTRDVPSLLALCRSVLERRAPDAPVRGVRVAAAPATMRREQLRLFGLPTVPPEKLATAVARVAAIVGDGRVGRAVLPDGHDPQAFTVGRFDPSPPPEDPPPARPRVAGISVLRVFRPPLDAEVRVATAGPQALRAPGVGGWIVSCAGPWRLDTSWHTSPVRRDAYDVELSDGAAYRLVQDLATGRWSVVGRYD